MGAPEPALSEAEGFANLTRVFPPHALLGLQQPPQVRPVATPPPPDRRRPHRHRPLRPQRVRPGAQPLDFEAPRRHFKRPNLLLVWSNSRPALAYALSPGQLHQA